MFKLFQQFSRRRKPVSTESSSTGTIWGLRDYGVYVPMTDAFYQTLAFRKTNREDFLAGTYEPQPDYHDSRTYMRPILKHLIKYAGEPFVFDVGGYIGRFSIETSLLCSELDVPCTNIVCFEPGDTIDLLEMNFDLNGTSKEIRCVKSAVTNAKGNVRFAIKDDARISSRILPDTATTANLWGDGWSESAVTSVTIDEYIDRSGRPFFCKIDTEGHEAQVIEGIGAENLDQSPHAIVVEFWPSLLDQTILGIPFEKYIFDNYSVFDIRSSLYPANYDELTNFDGVAKRINDKQVANLDLLLLRTCLPEHAELNAEIHQLAQLNR